MSDAETDAEAFAIKVIRLVTGHDIISETPNYANGNKEVRKKIRIMENDIKLNKDDLGEIREIIELVCDEFCA